MSVLIARVRRRRMVPYVPPPLGPASYFGARYFGPRYFGKRYFG